MAKHGSQKTPFNFLVDEFANYPSEAPLTKEVLAEAVKVLKGSKTPGDMIGIPKPVMSTYKGIPISPDQAQKILQGDPLECEIEYPIVPCQIKMHIEKADGAGLSVIVKVSFVNTHEELSSSFFISHEELVLDGNLMNTLFKNMGKVFQNFIVSHLNSIGWK